MGFDSPEKYWGPAEFYANPRRHSGTQFVRRSHDRKTVCSAASYLLKYMETLQHVYLQFWLLSSGFCSLHTSYTLQGRNHLSCLILAHQPEWTVHQEQWSSPGMHFQPVMKWTYPENKWELNKKGNTQQLLVWSIQVDRFPVTSPSHTRSLQTHPNVHKQGMILPKRILLGYLKRPMLLEALGIKKVPLRCSWTHLQHHLVLYMLNSVGNMVFDYMGTENL